MWQSQVAVVLEVVHSIKPLTGNVFDAWVEWYGNEIIPAMSRNGFDVLGAFKRSSGPMGEDLLLIRFETMADYQRCSLSLRNDRAFLKALTAIGSWNVRESSKMATFAPFATEQRLVKALAERPSTARQYLQSIFQIRSGGQLAAYEAVAKLAEIADTQSEVQLVTAYETTIGQRGELTTLWARRNGLPDLSYRAGDSPLDVIAVQGEATTEESLCFLNPLPYSRLQ